MRLAFKRWSLNLNENSSTSQVHLFFLHGLGGVARLFRPITAQLEQDFDCIAVDQRGHGESPRNCAYFGSLDYAQDVLDTMNELNLDRCFLIGHSMGVRTALAVTHLAPKRIRGLIGVDLSLDNNFGGGLGVSFVNFLMNLPFNFSDRSSLKKYLSEKCPDPSITAYLAASAIEENNKFTFPFSVEALRKTVLEAKDTPLTAWVQEAIAEKIPLLFLRGGKSLIWKKEAFEEQRVTFKGATFETWENSSHGLPFEERARFVERIKSFVTAETK